jgi:hypothetical protein
MESMSNGESFIDDQALDIGIAYSRNWDNRYTWRSVTRGVNQSWSLELSEIVLAVKVKMHSRCQAILPCSTVFTLQCFHETESKVNIYLASPVTGDNDSVCSCAMNIAV